MLRKTIIAFTAVAAVAGAALAPTSASAHGIRFHGHGGWGWGGYGGPLVVSNCYWVKKYTPFGVRFVKVCDY